jgi:transcriptional antiterminator NusG
MTGDAPIVTGPLVDPVEEDRGIDVLSVGEESAPEGDAAPEGEAAPEVGAEADLPQANEDGAAALEEPSVEDVEDIPAPQMEGPAEEVAAVEEPAEPEQEAAEDTPQDEASEEEPAPAARARGNGRASRRKSVPSSGPGDWYVVHTYAGYENKVKANLESRIHSMQMEDKIFDVHIPMEDVMEIKGGKKQVVQRKVFPGYLLVKMFYDNDSWYVVRNTPGVTGFVSSGTGTKPTPLSKREVEKILNVKKETETRPQFRLEYQEGDTVRIIAGPFADFNGTVSEINVDQSKLKVLVSIFDRETPVELGFDQVAKV